MPTLGNQDAAQPKPSDNSSNSGSRPHDPVNRPNHYNNHPSGIECIEIVEHMNFNRGNAIKYIWRADDKDDVIENLKKARWYINREIKRLGST